jgi:general secretion pathway protein J
MKQRGFTLLEMLIGITLLSFVLVLLYGGLRLGTRSWEAGEKAIETNTRQTLLADFLHRQLSLIYPLRWRQGEKGLVLAFAGEPHALSFSGTFAARSGPGGIHHFVLDLPENDKEHSLRLRWRLNGQEVKAFEFPEEKDQRSLVRGVESLDIAYFGALQADEEAVWHDTWSHDTELPMLIRVRLKLVDAESWQDIVVPLQFNQAQCRWNSWYKKCM